jgi:hypothetical protein
MPYSYHKFKQEIKDKILSNIGSGCKILDVGAGSGCYGDMLYGKYNKIDAIEIFADYIEEFKLSEKYNNVFQGNIISFDFLKYDFIIMGDILEHLSVTNAQLVLSQIESNKKAVLVAVPYLYEQGEMFGNVYEAHLQPDLTPAVMIERYPQLSLLYGDSEYGYYVNDIFNKGIHR